MSHKYTIDQVRNIFSEHYYTLITEEYYNNKQRLEYVCGNGHKFRSSLSEFIGKKDKRCSRCYKGDTLYIDIIRQEMAKEGYTLTSSVYKSCKEKLNYICPNGHKHNTSWRNWKSGSRCPHCSRVAKPTIEYIRSEFEKENYKLLTNEYINNKQKLYFICPNGHKYFTTWSSWSGKRKRRCLLCSGKAKHDKEFVRNEIEKDNYVLVSDYTLSRDTLHLICPNGHDYYVSWDNWSSKGYRCPKCNSVGVSKQELDFLAFIKSFCSDVNEHDRSLIAPYEIDVVIPSKKIAIEYCGLYWHSELAGKDKNYHLKKLEACESKGYRLITIFEDEWLFNRHIVESRIKNILNWGGLKTIFARKCIISEISTADARKFCNKNHLQGYGSGSQVKLGAFYEDKLVAVMTFSKPSVAKGNKNKVSGFFELHRFCQAANTRVIGVASKLLKYFERSYSCSGIFSYADCRWSNGNVYDKMGFTFIARTKPNYWYIRNQRRLHRFIFRKKSEEPKNITEWQIRQSQGWNRIWDCGNLKYEKIIDTI